jgi:hypothetical protein
MKKIVAALVLLVAGIVAYTQLGIFVVQPIGMLPEGKTIIIWRQSARLHFIDSADGVCLRIQDGVSIICRLAAMAGVVENNPILLRLPYSEALYLVSTGGRTFVR